MDERTQRHKIKRREVVEVMLMRKTRKDSLYIIREPVAHRLDVIVCMENWPTETMMIDLT